MCECFVYSSTVPFDAGKICLSHACNRQNDWTAIWPPFVNTKNRQQLRYSCRRFPGSRNCFTHTTDLATLFHNDYIVHRALPIDLDGSFFNMGKRSTTWILPLWPCIGQAATMASWRSGSSCCAFHDPDCGQKYIRRNGKRGLSRHEGTNSIYT